MNSRDSRSPGTDGCDADDRDAELGRIFDAYLAAVEAGHPPDPDRLLAENPACADRLRSFLEVMRLAQNIAGDAVNAHRVQCESTWSDASRAGSVSNALATVWDGPGPPPQVLLRDPPDAFPPLLTAPQGLSPAEGSDLGRYRLLGEIARGGMGAVIKGHDPDLGRDLAIKVLLQEHAGNPDVLRRFLEEAQIAGQLQHPGIVPIYELGAFADRRPFFAMKLVRGRTLAAELAERASAADDLPRVLRIFEQVCQTMAYAHARGVIHRDLKPSNVMIGLFGEVQVMDWGLAKVRREGGAVDDTRAALDEAHEPMIVRPGSEGTESEAGSVLGTPAYMPPEQARGEVNRLGARSDVFGLGAILCELLTGRPPYIGATIREVRAKSVRGDLAGAFDRLSACRADSELIDLARACLVVEPKKRPRDASEVAARLTSFREGVEARLRAAELARAEERARAEEAQARAVLERSRRRRTVALAASLLALATVAGVTSVSILQQRQARSMAVNKVLGEATTLLSEARSHSEELSRWQAVLASVSKVETIGAGDRRARARLAQLKAFAQTGLGEAARDATLRQALIEVRANQEEVGPVGTDEAYSAAFRAAGLDLDGLAVADAAARLRRRPAAVVLELAAFLDHWSSVARESGRPGVAWKRRLEVASAADADTYRNQIRGVLAAGRLEGQATTLKALAANAKSADLPAPTAVLLGDALAKAGEHETGVALLRQAAGRHPSDVWVNFALGQMLARRKSAHRDEAVRYFTAARALRPESANSLAHLLSDTGRGAEAEAVFRDLIGRRPKDAQHLGGFGQFLKDRGRSGEADEILDRALVAARDAIRVEPGSSIAHFNLGYALDARGMLEDAAAEYRKSLALKSNGVVHIDLGVTLAALGKLDDAVAEFRQAIRLNRDNAFSRINLGVALNKQGKFQEAEVELRAAVDLELENADAHHLLGTALDNEGKSKEAEAEYREAIRLKPDDSRARYNLGLALRKQGKPSEAEAEFREAIRVSPGDSNLHTSLGGALYDQGNFDGSIAEYRTAIRLTPQDPRAHYNLGNVLTTQGRLEESVTELREAIRLDPQFAEAHCNLARSLGRLGNETEALKEYQLGHELGTQRPGWAYPSAKWVGEAEEAVALAGRLELVLKGEQKPKDTAEIVAFAQLCSNKSLHTASARLWSDALAADPTLADNRGARHRYKAACAAALAGCGKARDDPPPDEAARISLRRQALDWLEAELSTWRKVFEADTSPAREVVGKTLLRWKHDPVLAGVRDPEAVLKLPQGEREAWQALWTGVDDLLKRVREMAGS